jgi:hypothetical protein
MRIAILGAGPTSIFVLAALRDRGHIPWIIANEVKASTPGAFYYHWVPDWIGAKPYPIEYAYQGTKEEYSLKQWGYPYPNSFGSYAEEIGYYPSEVASYVLAHCNHGVEKPTDKMIDGKVFDLCRSYDLVFCTFPLQMHMINNKTYFYPVTIQPSNDAENYIIYNGLKNDVRVRQSQLFGYLYTEYTKNTDLGDIPHFMNRDMHPTQDPVVDNTLRGIEKC